MLFVALCVIREPLICPFRYYRGRGALLKKIETLTYRGDNSRCIYKNRQNFSEVKNPRRKVITSPPFINDKK